MDSSVSAIKQLKFLSLTLQEKIDIKLKGRPTPGISIAQTAKSRGKPYVRQFSKKVYEDCDWICGCEKENALYCFPCLLFGGDTTWTKIGVKDLKHLSMKVTKHSNSDSHMNNMVNLSMLGRTSIASQINSGYQLSIARHNEKVTKNREVLSKIINCVKFCGKFELPLRGHDESLNSENPGVFRGLIDFSCQLDTSFETHFNSESVFKGSSKTIQNEILECILKICKEKIKEEIEQAKYFTVMCDETTDCYDTTQMAIVLRYVVKGKAVERFWGFFNPVNLTADALSTVLLAELEHLVGNSHEKLIGQTYDGAAALSGTRNGVQKKVKEVHRNAHFIHCYAHQLNLILQRATSQNRSARIFFNNLSGIPTFFSKSPQRMAALEKVAQRRIPSPSATRWNFKSRTVSSVFLLKDALIECCSELELSTSSATGHGAAGIKRMLKDENFLFFLSFFAKLMPHVDILFAQLQSRDVDAVKVNTSLFHFVSAIQAVRSECGESVASIEAQQTSARSIQAKEICDVIIVQCEERFKFTGHLEASKLLRIEKLPAYAAKFPEEILQKCVQAYPMLEVNKFRCELMVFYSRNDFRAFKGVSDILEFLHTNGLQSTFPEVIKLARILVSTPMTTAEAERCFSTLKRIKTFLRCTMTTDRLSALAMLSIESKMIAEMSKFNETVIDYFSKVKNRRMEFIFK